MLAVHSHAASSSCSSSSSFSSSWCDPERRSCQESGALPCDKASACEPCGQQNLGHKVRKLFPPSSWCTRADKHARSSQNTKNSKLTNTKLFSSPPFFFFKCNYVLTVSKRGCRSITLLSVYDILSRCVHVMSRSQNTQTHADLLVGEAV